MAKKEKEILDAEGDVDLNKFDKPLLYEFAYSVLHGKSMPNKKSEKKKGVRNWVQNFMNNDNYGLIDTKYDGNCFFSVLKLALDESEQNISIDDMREVLANNATEELFHQYKTMHDEFKTSEANLTREIKNITVRFNALQKKMKETKDRNLQLSFIKQADEMKIKHDNLKQERSNLKEIQNEFAFMDGIENLSMLKLKMNTNGYWADTWAISTLERELNVKIVIFSETMYSDDDIINVLQCGQLNDTILEKRGIFEPSFYILVSHHKGIHYQMITYNEQKSFDFVELPGEIKTLIVDKCLEKMAGPYSLIPEFAKLRLQAKANVIA